LDRLTRHFYWVGVGNAVSSFCRSCDVCQHLGKGAIPQRAQFKLPVIGNQCFKIAVDIVESENHCPVYHTCILIVIMNMLMSLLWFEYKVAQLKSMLKEAGATFPGDWDQLLP